MHKWMLAGCGLIMASPALAIELELSPGDDIANLTSSLNPGDQVILKGGTYDLTSALYWYGDGTEEAPITIKAADGEEPIILLHADPDSNWADGQILQIYEASYIEVSGLTFMSDDWATTSDYLEGVEIYNSSHISFTDVNISNVSSHLLYLSGNNEGHSFERVRLENNTLGHGMYAGCSDASCFTKDSSFDTMWISGVGYQYGWMAYFAHGAQNNSLTNSILYDGAYHGIFTGSTEFGDPNIIEGNAVWNMLYSGIYIQGGSIVRNNVVFNVDGNGIYVSDPERGTYDGMIISFNTVVNTGDYAAEIYGWTEFMSSVLANNAFCNTVGYGVYLEVEAASDTAYDITYPGYIANNVVCGYTSGLDRWEGHYIPGSGNADYSDIDAWDLYPTPESVLINAADPSSDAWVPTTDFNGATRPGDAPDVGAYEWSGAGNPGWALQEDFKQLGVESDNITQQVESGCCNKSESAEQAWLVLPLLGVGAWRRRRTRRE
jgi:hypothetical protein